MEGEKPSINIELPTLSIGSSQKLRFSVSDNRSGVRRIWIGLFKDTQEITLFEKDFPTDSFVRGGKFKQGSFEILIEPKKLGIKDGNAILRIAAWDFSWRGWFRGNRAYTEKNIGIDTRPPDLDVLSRVHNISQGGASLVIYKLSEPCSESGVFVGNDFFPGHPGYFKDANIFMAFFALNHKKGPETEIYIKAADLSGNVARAGFPYYIKHRAFKSDILNISDRFLKVKLPEFDIDIPPNTQSPLLAKFLKVNREVRAANYKKITELTLKTKNVLHWNGIFLRLPRSATRARFADHRKYKYNGSIVDDQVHLGVDLASLFQSPVPAANSGEVVFSDNLGIYGRTVLIDHGFGLFSMYSHLSHIDVTIGQTLSKGDIIGRTGTTGLAGGDHLHFSMLIHNTFVNPIEWWDMAWIKNNIATKIKTVTLMNK